MIETILRGSLRVALPPARTLPLFTARGETLWVPDWKPVYVSPPDGEPVEGGVWLTKDGDVEVIWRVQRWDPAAGVAEYLRVVPGNRVATVRVECAADGPHTAVQVEYRVTPIAPAGEAWLAQMDDHAFVEMMKEWERLIDAQIARGATCLASGVP
jgi:hypothetical protein